MSEQKIKVGITLGDVNGIGPEVIIKAFSDARMLELCTPVIYGSARALIHYKRYVNESDEFQFTVVAAATQAQDGKINLINSMGDELDVEAGVATAESARAAVAALKVAVEDIKAKRIDVMVTAPINNKECAKVEGFNFLGHTDYLADEFKDKPLMIMCGDSLRIGLETVHIPLSQVSESITKEGLVATLKRMRQTLIADFGIVAPKIAVLSLNPHAGDGGLLGDEEQRIIEPAIKQASEQDVLAFGPFASDEFFVSGAYVKYDAVLAMYHDQGLTPFKALSSRGINYTAGLPIVRTSPSHGVMYEMAGADKAEPDSMREAVYRAIDIWRRRKSHEEAAKNPLGFFERERASKDLSVDDLLPPEPENIL